MRKRGLKETSRRRSLARDRKRSGTTVQQLQRGPGDASGLARHSEESPGLLASIKEAWQAYIIWREVKDMNMNTVLKVACAALMAAVAAGGAQYLDAGAVSLPAVGSAVLAAVLAYLKRSPLA